MAGLIVTANMVDLWRELTNERNTTVVPDSVVYTYLNRGAERLNRRVGYHVSTDSSSITLVSGTQEYTLFSDLVEIIWVEHGGKLIPKGDVELWRSRLQDWRNEPPGYPKEWAIYADKLVFLPAPSAAAVATAANPVVRYGSAVPDVATYGFEQLNVQDQCVPVYAAVALWSASYPDSPLAQARMEYHEKLFEAESQKIAQYYAERRVAR